MTAWSEKVFIYEINTWVWLTELSQHYGQSLTLETVPDAALDELAALHVDAVWLMGVWQRSRFARTNALKYKDEYVRALPDLTDDDVIGSAYSIGAYEVDAGLGGRAALAHLRARLQARGLMLILDFVPNHVATDHPWIDEHPDYLISGKPKDARERPSDFFRHKRANGKSTVFAHGRDPYFPGWSDTAQLNAINPDLRAAVASTLLDIASQCDAVRCDMAMLVMNDIFANTWRGYIGKTPPTDYWPTIIPQVRAQYPDFKFIAEVYWGREFDMLMQGFDYCYDKTLYDRVMSGDIEKLRAHLTASIEFQRRMVRFIENHDEPRAFDRLGKEKSYPAATLVATLPGVCLLHQGQLIGARAKLPVQIRRGPNEPHHAELATFYHKLLEETRNPVYQTGLWYLFELRPAGPMDPTWRNLLAYGWCERGHEYRLIVVNLTPVTSYARLPVGFWSEMAGARWRLHDVQDDSYYERDGNELLNPGLFVHLQGYESHVFRFERL